jgi:hypothetical protein
MPIHDIERMELLSPGEAGTLYGGASWGVLLIETRTGPRRRGPAADPRIVSGFDWSAEQQPYRWKAVLGSSLVGNALGLGIALMVANKCLKPNTNGLLGVRSDCGPLITMGAGFVTLGLPSVAGSAAARWAGATVRSRGRLLPSAVLGSLAGASGYLFLVRGETGESAAAGKVGAVILTIGTPLLMTLSDRVFRALR